MGKVAPTLAETTKAKHKAFQEGDMFPEGNRVNRGQTTFILPH